MIVVTVLASFMNLWIKFNAKVFQWICSKADLELKSRKYILQKSIKNFRFAASFRGISWLSSGFMTLWWFRIAHICFGVTNCNKGHRVFSISQFCSIGNLFYIIKGILNPETSIKEDLHFPIKKLTIFHFKSPSQFCWSIRLCRLCGE